MGKILSNREFALNESSPWIKPFDRGQEGRLRKEDEMDTVEIDKNSLHEMLKKGIVHFVYRKKAFRDRATNEEVRRIRVAWGTKDFNAIDFPVPPSKGIFNKATPSTEIYIDVPEHEWRIAGAGGFEGAESYIYSIDEYLEMSDDERDELDMKLLKNLGLYDEFVEKQRPSLKPAPEVEPTPEV